MRDNSTTMAKTTLTPKRSTRLFKMLSILAKAPQTRDTLCRRLRVDQRVFYRDLELLRSLTINVTLEKEKYGLNQSLDDVLEYLPFPDPQLSYKDVQTLSTGRSDAHRKLAAHYNAQTNSKK